MFGYGIVLPSIHFIFVLLKCLCIGYYYKIKKKKRKKKGKMTPFYARFLDFPKYKFTLFSLKTLNSLSLSLSHSRRPNALPLSFRHLA